ncbi:MAG: 30S ribosomal protein S20 [Oscillospiraceae bacterium]
MPNIKSAKKRVKVIAAKAAENKAQRSALRTTVKKAELSLADSAGTGAEAVRLAIKTIDQAAAKGIIHKNTAARKKSALACKLNRAQAD